jgi:hypothetical protein
MNLRQRHDRKIDNVPRGFYNFVCVHTILSMRGRLGLIFLVLIAFTPARAVLFDSTNDPNFNTTSPGGTFGSGWDFEGQWGGVLGTPIAPQYFITAAHVGGSVGDTFTFGGLQYTTTAMFNSPNSDLRIWQVSGTFPIFAPLYTGGDEVGKSLVVFGRGTQRGDPEPLAGQLHGWRWGTADQIQRWGTNVISGITIGTPQQGDFLTAAFDHNFSATEADLSSGDSGGAVFIQDAMGNWKLAGINYGIDSPYSLDPSGSHSFAADLFDQSGYYLQNDTTHMWEPATGPGHFYATRISSNDAWIMSVIPEPSIPVLFVCGLSILLSVSRVAWRQRS